MDTSQIKTLVVNIVTGLAVVGVLVVGYYVFLKKDTIVTPEMLSSVETAQETVIIGSQVSKTLRDLEELKQAVVVSVGVFQSRAFRELEDFSAKVPSEEVGRDNPFEPTSWKLQQKETESSAQRGGQGSSSQTQQASASATVGTGGFDTNPFGI